MAVFPAIFLERESKMNADKPSIPGQLLLGHALMIITGIMYSIYWTMGYYSNSSNTLAPIILFLFAASILIGFFGIFLFYVSSSILLKPNRSQNWPVIIGGIVLYALSLVIMDKVYERAFTTEIFFAFLWAISEMNAIYSVYKAGCIGKGLFYLITGGVLVNTAVNLVCYRIHLELDGFDRFINGLIPYLVNILVMAGILMILRVNRNPKET